MAHILYPTGFFRNNGSLILLSRSLWDEVYSAVRKKIGGRIEKITKDKIREAANQIELQSQSLQQMLQQRSIVIAPHAIGVFKEGDKLVVWIALDFPFYGESRSKSLLWTLVATQVGLDETKVNHGMFECAVSFSKDEVPVEVDLSQISNFRGHGQRAFVTRLEAHRLFGENSPTIGNGEFCQLFLG